MAAFAAEDPHDRASFQRHWDQILSDNGSRIQTVEWHGKIAGYVTCFELFGKPSLAYWIGREFWGQGIATAAVKLFLRKVPERPLFARVAADNLSSIRVLEKSGFMRTGLEKSYASARRSEIEEYIFRLGEP
jgi:RimJ/RimL family protein N-acetyltransferase